MAVRYLWMEKAKHNKLHWLEYLHHAYVVLALIGMFASQFSSSNTFKETALLVAFCCYLIVLFMVFIAVGVLYSKKSSYAEAMSCVHQAIDQARDLYRYLDCCQSDRHPHVNYSSDYIRKCFTEILSSTSKGFSMATGVSCRCTIKLLGRTEDEVDRMDGYSRYFAKTFARDGASASKKRDVDSLEGKRHRLSENSPHDRSIVVISKLSFYVRRTT